MAWKFISTVVLIITFTNAKGQDQWDLKRCVDYALTNNISVKQADLQTRFSKLQLDLDKLARWPTANFQASSGYSFGLSENPSTGTLQSRNFFNTQVGLSSNVTIFNWFSRRYQISASELALQADQAQVSKVQNDIALNVAVGYLQALLAKQQVVIAGIQVLQTEQQLDVTRRRVKAGSLPELNALQLESQLAADSTTLVTAQGNVQQLILQLKALLNLDAGTPFDIAAPPVEMIPVESLSDLQPESVYQLALVNFPQQRVNDLRVQSAQKTVSVAKAGMYPTFSAFGQLTSSYVNAQTVQSTFRTAPDTTGAIVKVNGTEYPVLASGIVPVLGLTPIFNQFQNNFGQNIGIGVTVPIFNGGSRRGNWKRAQLDVQRLQLTQESDNLTLKQDIYRAYSDAVTAVQRYNASRKAVEAASRAANFARKRYDANLLTTFELINSENNLRRAQQDMLSAQFDYVFRLKLLEFYKGQGIKL